MKLVINSMYFQYDVLTNMFIFKHCIHNINFSQTLKMMLKSKHICGKVHL